jgi:hypothetical protein
MAKTKKSSGGKRVMDVTHPDESAPSGNSKSVIISNRPLLQDPMVVDASSPAEPIITPPETAADDKTDFPAPAAESAIKPDKTEPAIESADKPAKPATDEPDEHEDEDDEDPQAEPKTEPVDKSPVKSDKSPKKPDAEAEEQAKHQAAVDKLTDGKKYYLPIDTIEKKRSRRFVVIGIILSLLLIVAWADIALDAGIIQLGGVKSVTHFFSN